MRRTLAAYEKLFWISLGLAILLSGLEVWTWLPLDDARLVLQSISGQTASAAAAVLLLAGGWLVFLKWTSSSWLSKLTKWMPRFLWLRYLAVTTLTFAVIWMFLFSAWRLSFPGPFTHYLIVFAAACVIALIVNELRDDIGWREVVVAIGLYVYAGSVAELRISFSSNFVFVAIVLLGSVLLFALINFQYSADYSFLQKRLLDFRSRLGRVRWLVFWLLILSPLFVRLIFGASFYVFNPNVSFVFLAVAFLGAAFLLTPDSTRLLSFDAALAASGMLFTVAMFVSYLYLVSNYPFSLSWSEGNRLYDYSLIFAQNIYKYPAPIISPYNSPGRYALWGLPFLWSGLPIWVHRFWAVVLRILPPLLFGWFVSAGIRDRNLRWGMAFWVLLIFIVPTTIYAPILLSAVLVMLFAFQPSLLMRSVAVIVAGIYASLSRWTWFLAPAAWAAIVDLLLYYPGRKLPFIRKILPTILVALAGMVAGLLPGQKALTTYVSPDSLISNQPLLWYRLFPNQTYSLGLILGTLIVTGPLLAILAWWMISRRWKLDWLQMLAIWGTLTGFLGVGLVISTKIGGGGDLHNLDLYLITLAFVFAMGIYFLWMDDQLHPSSWPFWTQAMLFLYVALIVYRFMPFSIAGVPASMQVPPPAQVQNTLDTIRKQAAQASQTGEVLFMDQRQLLTFGYVREIPFVPDYEKKYMMDQALGSNRNYFQQYYLDLSRKRFGLIITEPLKRVIKGRNTDSFSDENDAWVRWVSDPTLCFYKPIFTDQKVGVQLLAPRDDTTSCGKYLTGE